MDPSFEPETSFIKRDTYDEEPDDIMAEAGHRSEENEAGRRYSFYRVPFRDYVQSQALSFLAAPDCGYDQLGAICIV